MGGRNLTEDQTRNPRENICGICRFKNFVYGYFMKEIYDHQINL